MIKNLVRKNILNLKPYSSARDEFKGNDAVFLDANENPFGTLNRYPDPHQMELKKQLSVLKKQPISQIFVGNGSDEVIDLTLRIFCEPAEDKIIICPPTYGMYEVAANINNIEIIEIPLTSTFQLDIPKILDKIEQENIKVIFICSPNNPSGNSLDDIEIILEKFKGIIFIDEAYIDFSERETYLSKLKNYSNVIISQTLSKAWGLAGARVGLAFSSEEIIALFNRVKPPYNISKPNQDAALKTIKNQTVFEENLASILKEREKMKAKFATMSIIKKIYPTDANFILVEIDNATNVYNLLVDKKVITRNRSSVVKNTLRISIGTPEENELLINELQKL